MFDALTGNNSMRRYARLTQLVDALLCLEEDGKILFTQAESKFDLDDHKALRSMVGSRPHLSVWENFHPEVGLVCYCFLHADIIDTSGLAKRIITIPGVTGRNFRLNIFEGPGQYLIPDRGVFSHFTSTRAIMWNIIQEINREFGDGYDPNEEGLKVMQNPWFRNTCC